MRQTRGDRRAPVFATVLVCGMLLTGCSLIPSAGEPAAEASATGDPEPEVTEDDIAEGEALPLLFDDEMTLAPRLAGDSDLYPFGLPDPISATLGAPEWADPDEVDESYYGGFAGGTAQHRELLLSYGDQEVSVELIFPRAIPVEMLEANAGRDNIALDTIEVADVSFIPAGTPARTSCAIGGGEVVAGWNYDGSPGTVTVGVLVDIGDDAALAGVGLIVQWTGGWERQTLDGADDSDIGDGCDEASGLTEWGWGTALKDG